MSTQPNRFELIHIAAQRARRFIIKSKGQMRVPDALKLALSEAQKGEIPWSRVENPPDIPTGYRKIAKREAPKPRFTDLAEVYAEETKQGEFSNPLITLPQHIDTEHISTEHTSTRGVCLYTEEEGEGGVGAALGGPGGELEELRDYGAPEPVTGLESFRSPIKRELPRRAL